MYKTNETLYPIETLSHDKKSLTPVLDVTTLRKDWQQQTLDESLSWRSCLSLLSFGSTLRWRPQERCRRAQVSRQVICWDGRLIALELRQSCSQLGQCQLPRRE